MRYLCCQERRLAAVKRAGALNGIEYVEVSDSEAPSEALRQRTLFVRLLRPAAGIAATQVRIDGGERIRTVAVEWAAAGDALPAGEAPSLVDGLTDLDHVLVVRTADRGDFSWYTLHIVAGPGSSAPPSTFDPLLAEVPFSFKVECGSDFDCREVVACPPAVAPAPAIDYLAKDYPSLRRLLLDRISLLAPDWRERSPADLGVALVELLAYAGDQLSYRQDAVATEAFLGTARSRVSLRRHARLVDYLVHEGCAARALVRAGVTTDGVTLPAGTPLLTRTAGVPDRVVPGGGEHRAALAAGAVVFETAEPAVLYPDHDVLPFYTWGDRDCCLPRGACSATLRGHYPNLKAGDLLVLAETTSPTTGRAEDADVAHRWPVRLTAVVPGEDPSGGLFDDPPDDDEVDVTRIEWDAADALPFPLCVSATLPAAGDADATFLEVGVAWGNIVVADHGATVAGEDLGVVPAATRVYAAAGGTPPCQDPPVVPVPVRFQPTLARGPVAHTVDVTAPVRFSSVSTPTLLADLAARSFSTGLHDWLAAHGILFQAGPAVVAGGDGEWSVSDGATVVRVTAGAGQLVVRGRPVAASAVTAASPRLARPAVVLSGALGPVTDDWLPRADLLASGPEAAELVLETEHDGTARVRFGDGVHGRRPAAQTAFTARYRVGNGVAGNIGAEALAHVATLDSRVSWVRNPLPAAGGVDPERAEDVRRDAPEAFKVQERAVTEADYAEVARRHPRVQRAAATFRWTGSWHTVFVTVDPLGGGEVTPELETELRAHLERYRMAGYDLEVDGPAYVALDLGLHVCVQPEHFRAAVRRDLLAVLGSGRLPDGRPALFHPDSFTFGQPVYLSPVLAAAQSVPGVASVRVYTFARRGQTGAANAANLAKGVLAMGRLEVARLDNNPSFPERGVLALSLGGGK
ncbi:MAG TPA: putative baseplate assembly protein [Micromonosporaceae bacterium]|nr:putative baseplate assembly protein [Micromonosporaceae bacterium]